MQSSKRVLFFKVSSFPPSILDTNSLPITSLRCNIFCKVNNILLNICLSYFFVHFKKGPEYRVFYKVFIPLMRFLLQRLVLRNFLVL